jgi:hypothetical protein
MNTYGYVGSNPINFIDPSGLFQMRVLTTWEDVMEYGDHNYRPGLTQQWLKGLKRGCSESDCGRWSLDECSALYHIKAMIWADLSPLPYAISRRYEGEHVDDLKAGVDRLRKAAEAVEAAERQLSFSSEQACRNHAWNAVRSSLLSTMGDIGDESIRKRHGADNRGHGISPWLNW